MATVGTQLTAFAPHYNDCPSLQHSGSSSPAQLALFANPLQDTISMLHEGLAVSPTVNQSHVGFLGMVSVCHMWLDDAYATCLGSHSLGTARTQWQAAFVSALACNLSRYEFAPYTYTHARTSFKSVKHWLQQMHLSCFVFWCRCGHSVLTVCLVQPTSHLNQHAAVRIM